MQIMTLERVDINLDSLDEALTEALPAVYLGSALRPDALDIHLDDAASAADCAQVRRIVREHDPMQQSRRQQAAQARRHALIADREAHRDEINPADYAAESALIQALARRVRWLEREIRAQQ